MKSLKSALAGSLGAAMAVEIAKERYDVTDSGLVFPVLSVQAKGMYRTRVNQGEWDEQENLVIKEGLIDVINTYFIQSHPKKSSFHLALFSGNTAPASNWTAANFATVASEIVSQTEGYTGATRPTFTPTAASADTFSDNYANTAKVTFATASQLNVTGIALLTNNQRGGTTGVLVSATKWPATRVFQNGDEFELGYRFELTV